MTISEWTLVILAQLAVVSVVAAMRWLRKWAVRKHSVTKSMAATSGYDLQSTELFSRETCFEESFVADDGVFACTESDQDPKLLGQTISWGMKASWPPNSACREFHISRLLGPRVAMERFFKLYGAEASMQRELTLTLPDGSRIMFLGPMIVSIGARVLLEDMALAESVVGRYRDTVRLRKRMIDKPGALS